MSAGLAALPLSELTFDAVQAESLRARLKHGPAMTCDNPHLPTVLKLAALVEEVGEVANALTYDGLDRDNLVKELIQVASVACMWIESLEGEAARSIRPRVFLPGDEPPEHIYAVRNWRSITFLRSSDPTAWVSTDPVLAERVTTRWTELFDGGALTEVLPVHAETA